MQPLSVVKRSQEPDASHGNSGVQHVSRMGNSTLGAPDRACTLRPFPESFKQSYN